MEGFPDTEPKASRQGVNSIDASAVWQHEFRK
jgi:hypothetical protein